METMIITIESDSGMRMSSKSMNEQHSDLRSEGWTTPQKVRTSRARCGAGRRHGGLVCPRQADLGSIREARRGGRSRGGKNDMTPNDVDNRARRHQNSGVIVVVILLPREETCPKS